MHCQDHGAHLKENNKLYFCPLGTDLKDKETLLAIDDVMGMLEREIMPSCRIRFYWWMRAETTHQMVGLEVFPKDCKA